MGSGAVSEAGTGPMTTGCGSLARFPFNNGCRADSDLGRGPRLILEQVLKLTYTGLFITYRLPIQTVCRAVNSAVREINPTAVTLGVNLLVPDGKPCPALA